MPVLPNDEIEAKLRDQGLSVHIAYRQMRALESIAEYLERRDTDWKAIAEAEARDFYRHRPSLDAHPQKS